MSVHAEQDHVPTLTHATERDIDLLLVEELKCSRDFVEWFTQRVAGVETTATTQIDVLHSQRRIHTRREIDITLRIRQGDHNDCIILIENKLDSPDQPHQAESYRDEAKLLLQTNAATLVRIALVCPREYDGRNRDFARKFDAVVLYEEMMEFIRQRSQQADGEMKARLRHRSELLEQAITKARRGYVAVPLPVISTFNKLYVGLCHTLAPELKPGAAMLAENRPGESKTMIFSPDNLPDWDFLPQMRLVHQLREGNANLNFYGWGDHFPDIAAQVSAALRNTPYRAIPSVNKRKAGRSGLMIVAATPVADNTLDFAAQREAIETGIRATAELRNWLLRSKRFVSIWADRMRAAKARSNAN